MFNPSMCKARLMKRCRILVIATCLVLVGSIRNLRPDRDIQTDDPSSGREQRPAAGQAVLAIGPHPSRGKAGCSSGTPSRATTAWVVEYRPGAGRRWQTAQAPVLAGLPWPESSRTGFGTPPMTGLEPGQVFAYRLSTAGNVVFESEARAPRSPDQPHRFVVFGDCAADTAEQRAIAYRAFCRSPTSS